MWFSTDKEIITKKKKRNDFLPHELYITPSWDINPLTAINGKATVLSFDMFQRRTRTSAEEAQERPANASLQKDCSNNANFEQKVQGEEDIAVHPSGNTQAVSYPTTVIAIPTSPISTACRISTNQLTMPGE
ncbi:hypothetical protein BJF96_g2349 [Verticillium dahliae]|uniref:Uncharacterized protein n=1 Tax=Verticillium dahliae TaxID=27337 RepID=A0AA44WP70_VERDA|nr:hypothetical protein BJF96_g2349 [Verticillium dahliae]PNH53222.1 hypothetical protein VD0003_g4168 [Verticillium dahliae]